jgi:hypothetical protein
VISILRDQVPFADPESIVEDPRGNIWIAENCALKRVDPDGTIHTVLDKETVCPVGEPDNYIPMEHMVWDASKDELVTAGDTLSQRPPKANLYSTVWRIQPDGQARRVYIGLKLGESRDLVDGIGGLALDGKGRIHFGTGIAASGGGMQIRRLDEATGTTVIVAGTPRPTDVNHADGPARQACFGTIRNLWFAPEGVLYIHDSTQVIRKMTPEGKVTTWAF